MKTQTQIEIEIEIKKDKLREILDKIKTVSHDQQWKYEILNTKYKCVESEISTLEWVLKNE